MTAASPILAQLDTFGPGHCARLDYDQADAYTATLARSHYENFTVVSWLLPRRLRAHFHHVYAFCRWADDLGDETGDPQRSIALLAWWCEELAACYADRPRHPVFVALHRTIGQFDIPRRPFDDLIDAFVQDQTVTRYRTWEQVLDYCTRSANPVGRLVLYVCGYRDAHRQELSDATCTALQLANFWQDVRRDILERDRVYLPEDVAGRHGLDLDLVVKAVRLDAGRPGTGGDGPAACCPAGALPSVGITALLPAYRAAVADLVDRTWPLFQRGRGLWPLVAPEVRLDLKLFTLGGESILRLIRRRGCDTLTGRPVLSRPAKTALLLRALAGKLAAACTRGQRGASPA